MSGPSGLAFLPLAGTPADSATKAAIHPSIESLRYQFAGTRVDVVEIVPPYVQIELMGEQQANDPDAMPLAEFIDEVMTILDAQADVRKVLVKRVLPLRSRAALRRLREAIRELERPFCCRQAFRATTNR